MLTIYDNTLFLVWDWALMQHFILSSSLRKLQDICYPDVDDQRWFSNLEATHWLDHIKVTCRTLWITHIHLCTLQFLHHAPMPPSCTLQCLHRVPLMPPSCALQRRLAPSIMCITYRGRMCAHKVSTNANFSHINGHNTSTY